MNFVSVTPPVGVQSVQIDGAVYVVSSGVVNVPEHIVPQLLGAGFSLPSTMTFAGINGALSSALQITSGGDNETARDLNLTVPAATGTAGNVVILSGGGDAAQGGHITITAGSSSGGQGGDVIVYPGYSGSAIGGSRVVLMTGSGSEAVVIGDDGSATLLGFFGSTPVATPNVAGSRGGNVALANLLTALTNLGLITNTTTA